MSVRLILFAITIVALRPVDGRANRKKARRDFARKCIYANEKFPIARDTCHARPTWNFKHIYDADPDVELWMFQRYNCLPRDEIEHPSTELVILFYMAMVVLIWIAITDQHY